jgi:hypothetical protein
MTDASPRDAPTLADLVGSLVAGDACPWCGDALQSGQSRFATLVLVCRSCGCEVETEQWPFQAGASEKYYLAA